jgi:hypothetical protein
VCQSYITDSKCKKNSDRKIVLPNGQFTLRSIPGRYIKERIDEWHKRNPSASTSSSLMYEISPISMPAQADVKSTIMISTPSTNVLTVEQWIVALEQEIFALRSTKKNFNGVEITRPPPRANKPAHPDLPKSTEPSAKPKPTEQLASSSPIPSKPSQPPVHPFSNTGETSYQPPHE